MEGSTRQARAERYSIGAVTNALAILRLVGERERIGLADAARAAEVSKSTAYRLLATLEAAGLVERLPEGGYRAGLEAVRWAMQLMAQLDVRTTAAPYLRQLWERTGETANLALLREGRLVYVEILESALPFRMADVPGSAAPLHATALGKAVAVHLDPHRLAGLLGPEPYPALTVHTATTWRDLRARLDETRARGFAVDREEVALGVTCVAAPILARDEVVGAISVSGPRARLTDARLAEVAEQVLAAAHQVSQRLSPRG
ncbi:MAG: hypothetical protein A2X23_08645 [Chloroflexi bacterium GWC2_73_18]|nr:MAG: hypothetical protein A2X23_08645 [Chloroflexi bacterium GWC2_73_18]